MRRPSMILYVVLGAAWVHIFPNPLYEVFMFCRYGDARRLLFSSAVEDHQLESAACWHIFRISVYGYRPLRIIYTLIYSFFHFSTSTKSILDLRVVHKACSLFVLDDLLPPVLSFRWSPNKQWIKNETCRQST